MGRGGGASSSFAGRVEKPGIPESVMCQPPGMWPCGLTPLRIGCGRNAHQSEFCDPLSAAASQGGMALERGQAILPSLEPKWLSATFEVLNDGCAD